MGISSLILLLVSICRLSFADSNEDLLRSQLRNHPTLQTIESQIFTFLNEIKAPDYQFSSTFTLTSSEENEFETVYYYEATKGDFRWIIDSPTPTGGTCGLIHLQIVGKIDNIHYATLYLQNDCIPIGISFVKDKLIQHIDLASGSIEVVDPNPSTDMSSSAVEFPNEDFSTDNLSENPEVRVCIIDNGLRLSHPGLHNRMAKSETGEILALDLTDNDNNTFTDSPHGTHVAGIASKNSHQIKIVGVKLTTNDNIRLGNVWRNDQEIHDNVLNELKKALEFCQNNNATIVNLSLVYGEPNPFDEENEEEIFKLTTWKQEYREILAAYPEMLFTVAAGNTASLIDETTVFPAGIDLENVITVGAYDGYTKNIWFEEDGHGSNYSPNKVDILAPGVLINSFSIEDGFDSFSGTSMASPRVANELAHIKLQKPNLTNLELKENLFLKAEKIDSLKTKVKDGKVLLR
ncbi:MAG: S8 family serine peptidase [Bdellovibrionales bacterium]|nr:S8 family serine peptidase [Bdellovibrionales bacterium]